MHIHRHSIYEHTHTYMSTHTCVHTLTHKGGGECGFYTLVLFRLTLGFNTNTESGLVHQKAESLGIFISLSGFSQYPRGSASSQCLSLWQAQSRCKERVNLAYDFRSISQGYLVLLLWACMAYHGGNMWWWRRSAQLMVARTGGEKEGRRRAGEKEAGGRQACISVFSLKEGLQWSNIPTN